ncbi:hypothetical protein CTI12_AA498140 [Artemisia annua]|uniref:Reverse transcriptase zinc-binding domain-containing protein n=1 Tax=Artemisia annua TaxID=35608 RepID=A0A2U1LES6_ARTAN|nr:hypothetical protein CTI12_AA498140 [Artemisia annua]
MDQQTKHQPQHSNPHFPGNQMTAHPDNRSAILTSKRQNVARLRLVNSFENCDDVDSTTSANGESMFLISSFEAHQLHLPLLGARSKACQQLKLATIKNKTNQNQQQLCKILSRPSPSDRADIICRVFEQKIKALIKNIDLHSILCPVCDSETESMEHLMVYCSWSNVIWNKVFQWRGFCLPQDTGGNALLNIIDFVRNLSPRIKASFKPLQLRCFEAVLFTLAWVMWRSRNRKVFTDKS